MHNAYAITSNNYNDLTIIVSSCDKYASLWNPFFTSLFKHWPSLNTGDNKSIPIILISNTRQYNNPRVQTLKIQPEKSWSDNMLSALNNIDTQYVMLFLDDYWIVQDIDEEQLHYSYRTLQDLEAAMIQVSNYDPQIQVSTPISNLTNINAFDKFSPYKTSLQLAIWHKQSLQYLLKSGEDPWSFELSGSVRAQGYPKPFLAIINDSPIKYINAVQQGYVNRAAIKYIEQNNIYFDKENMPIAGKTNFNLSAKIWVKRIGKLFNFIKKPGSFHQIL